jgi:hypothetical protein
MERCGFDAAYGGRPGVMRAILRTIFGVILWMGVSSARETWVVPERFTATPGATLRFELLSSASFYGSEPSEAVGKVARVRSRLGGGDPVVLALSDLDGKGVGFSATLSQPGVAAILVEFEASNREFDPEKWEAYLRGIHVGERARDAMAEGQIKRRVRERIVRRTQSFVRVGEALKQEARGRPQWGETLELVPVNDPVGLRVGEAFSVKIFQAGLPLEGQAVSFMLAGGRRERVVFSASDGGAVVRLDAPGLWLVACVDLRRSEGLEADWLTEVSTLVIEVK